MTAKPRNAPRLRRVGGVMALGIALLVALAALGLIMTAWRTVPPGFVGVKFDKARNRVTNTAEPGWTFINPFTESITEYPVSVQTLVMVQQNQEGEVQGDDSVKVGSREGQTMFADVSVNYSVERANAARLYETWAGAPITRIEENFVRQITRSSLNDVASQYGWEDIYGEKRNEYSKKVGDEIARRLSEKFIKFESLSLRGWHLPDNLQAALDQKIAAQQAAEQQKFQLEQARTKAEQDQVTAQGQANATREAARGEADAIRLRAAAQAEANRLLAQSLNADIIRYQQMQKWDGKLPVFSGGGATPLIDATSLISDTVTP